MPMKRFRRRSAMRARGTGWAFPTIWRINSKLQKMHTNRHCVCSPTMAITAVKDHPQLVEKSEGDLLQMVVLMPAKDLDEATLHERRGDSYFARKLYEEAIVEYSKSIAIDRYNASALNRLGLVYHQSQKLDDAERYYREALKQNPYFIEVLNNIGTVEYAR